VNYSCDWRPTVYLSISAAIFVGSILFTLFCLYCIRPKFREVLASSRVSETVQLHSSSIEAASPPKTKGQYQSLNNEGGSPSSHV